MQIEAAGQRRTTLRRALRLEWFTVGWNLVEGIVSVGAAVAASSVVLLGFGIDSFVETSSAAVLIWRLRAETAHADEAAIQRLEHRARRLVAVSLFALGVYVTIDASLALLDRQQPEASVVGIVVTSLSLVVMWWLARTKRDVARQLGSRALEADAFQTTACWWLSLVALTGLGFNAVLGWWWADPAAAIGAAFFIAREGLAAWRGDDCC